MIILRKYPFSSSFCHSEENSCRRRRFCRLPLHSSSVARVCSYHDHKFQFKYWFHCCCHRLRLLLRLQLCASTVGAIQSSIRFGMGKITIYIQCSTCWRCCLGAVCDASVIVIRRKLNYFLRLHLSLNCCTLLAFIARGSSQCTTHMVMWTSIWTPFRSKIPLVILGRVAGSFLFRLHRRMRQRCVACFESQRISALLKIYVNSM